MATVKCFVAFCATFLSMEIFGKRMKELREERGLTQTEVAKSLGTSKQNISKWERNRIEPDQKTMLFIAQFFNVSMDYLFGLKDD